LNEIDVLQAMKNEGVRLIMLGNKDIEQNMFLLNARSDKSLFQRYIQSNNPQIIHFKQSYSQVNVSPPEKKGKKAQ
jgi:hypothetical protein